MAHRAARTDLTSVDRPRKRRFGITSGRETVLFLVVPLGIYAVLYLLPNVLNLGMALTNWSTHRTSVDFVGVRNFVDLWEDGTLARAIPVTLRYALVVTIIQNVGALLLAFALERPTRVNIFLRTAMFVPVLISGLAAGYLFKGIFDPQGVINQFLSVVTGSKVAIPWLGSVDYTLYVVAFVHAWKFMGLAALIYIAGLVTIPRELIDAARIDGASEWQLIRRIKFPLMAPALTFNLSLTVIGTLSAFDIILAMTNGGPAFTTSVLNIVVQRQFGSGSFGYGTAASLVLLIAVSLIAIPTIMFLRRREIEL